ncbi:helix-turn-helix domain-containing protein [Paenibacillus radicis (ex Xue et al. 2023)]|uniref:Helix-turn-helix domain-containing protein n=1 Tax=Paenibacillus radicis (ex Xue et al. 2023) TaxID=2972489 RepID=A0ABT1YPP5_9BACL|nr:helix-turn-helix domain-containing protein [Paenibacillus radicis (ex Xue et al. 2023)]MCR8635152.1 helix-turn-helix domain-containing protein [Paenibacillus radicis (ex Xue et al. 2023)]
MASQLGRIPRFLTFGKYAPQGKYLHRLIWIGCISVCVPIILAGIIYYQFSMDKVKRQFLDENKSSLVMMKDRAERILQSIEQESLQLSLDSRINDFFAGRMEDAPLIWHQQLLQEITLVKNANSFIDEIYFYNNQEDILLTNRYGSMSKDSYKHKEDIDLLMQLESGSQWIFLPAGKKEGYITFARKLPVVGNAGKQGVLAFDIETSLISNFLQADTTILTKGPEMLMVSYPNLSKLDSKSKEHIKRLLENHPVLQTIGTADSTIDSFFDAGVDGRQAQFTYLKSIFGRTYVTVIPEQMLEERIGWIRIVTIIVALFFILLGILLTYFSTKKAYSPIEKLIQHSQLLSEGRIQNKEDEFAYIRACLDYLSQETEKLGGYMEKVQPTLREKCLQQLVNGEYVRNESLIQECESYGIDIKSTYSVIVVEVENAYKEKRFFPKDKPIIAFAVMNVMQELLQKNELISGYIFTNQGKAVALLQWKCDIAPIKLHQAARSFADSVSQSLTNYLSFQATVGIGRSYSHIADVPLSYKEAELALQYRIYQDSEPVMYIEDLESSRKQASFRYPRELESSIVDSLVKGELAQAQQSLVQFTESIRSSQSYNFIYQSYHVLLSAVITSLEKQGGSILDILEYNLFGQLEAKQTSREIFAWFIEILFPLYHKLTEEYRSSAGQSAVLQISKYIREHSTEDLSLVHCAEMIAMSPSYLSRLFKKEMGINFLDFVVECKVEEAKRLLLETDLNVSEIAAAIGYSERNLNRIFQRHTKMNPSIFRAEHR